MKLLHFDKDRYLAFASDGDKKFFTSPPFDTLKPLSKNLDFPGPDIEFSNKEDLFQHIKVEFAVANMSNMMDIWHKYNSSSVANMSPEKIRSQMIKYMEREFGAAEFNDVSLRDYHTFHLAFGFPIEKLSMALRYAGMSNEEKAKSIKSRLTQPSGLWKHDLDKIVKYVESNLMKTNRVEDADKVLSLIKIHPEVASDKTISKVDGLMDKTKAVIRQRAIDNGESLAKPWQKYINPEPNYHFAGPNEKKKKQDN